MQQILVTTDLSSASRAAVRFAIQLATQMDVKLVFFHCFQSLVPTSIHRERIDQAIREQTEEHREKTRTAGSRHPYNHARARRGP